MKNFKLKTEISSFGDIFCSFNKSGVMKKYVREDNKLNYSYILLSFDQTEFKISLQKKEIILFEIFIEEKRRGTGFAKELMKKTIDFIKSKGLKSIVLHACTDWKGTEFSKLKNFYESFGFVQLEENKEYFRLVF